MEWCATTKPRSPGFGGKSKAAPLVWSLLGDTVHFVEPFAGALGVLLERPHPCNRPYHSETICDRDGLVVNAWRAIQWHPEETAEHASWPVSEADKQARQIAVLRWCDEKTLDLLAGSAEWCDPKMAGWWLYGICCQIGTIKGPWTADPVTGRIVKLPAHPGVYRDRPHLADDGQGVNHAGTREPGVRRNLPHLADDGQGVNRPQLREPGVSREEEFHAMTMPELVRWFQWLSARLRHVRIVNGDWSRVVTSGAAKTLPVRQGAGPAGIFLDPPYAMEERDGGLYHTDEADLAVKVRAWCKKNGTDPQYRIVLAGFDTEHGELEEHGWKVHDWYRTGYLTGGMGNIDGTSQSHRERLWSSPHCLSKTQLDFGMFDTDEDELLETVV